MLQMSIENQNTKYKIIGDLTSNSSDRDVTELYAKNSSHGIQEDESRIKLSWRVVHVKTGNTMCVFGGGDAYTAAVQYCNYCEEHYSD